MYADLHIHSVLSPCADRAMIPQNIFPQVDKVGINIFAICDHNSGWNVRAFSDFGKEFYPEIVVVPGIEITTKEEVHVVGLFPSVERVEAISIILESLLPDVQAHPDIYSPQLVIDYMGTPIREVSKPLYYAVNLSLEETVELIREHKGIAISAHIDRPSFSVISQLGSVPDNLFNVVEVSPTGCKQAILSRNVNMRGMSFPVPEELTIISSSDAHSLDEIGCVKTKLDIDLYSFKGLLDILRKQPEIEIS